MNTFLLKKLIKGTILSVVLMFSVILNAQTQNSMGLKDISHLVKKGATTQLVVDGRPFLVLGGELGNSTFTSLDYMTPVWPKLKAMNMNTMKG